jgi:hypothetical protein
MGSPVQGMPRNLRTATPQTPPFSFDDVTLADPPLFTQPGPGQFTTNGWPEMPWEEDPFNNSYDVMP